MAAHPPSDAVLALLTEAIASAPSRCAYAEARHVATDTEAVLVRNGRVEEVDSDAVAGIGVRVRVGDGWGFAATREETAAGVERALARALAIAESQPTAPAGPLAHVEPARGHWQCPYEVDPLGGLPRRQARAAVRRRGRAARRRPAHRPQRRRVRKPAGPHDVRIDGRRRLHAAACRMQRGDRA